MAHLKPKQLLLIGLIVVIFCVLAAMTPLGARTSMVLRFQIAELSADNSNDEYNMDSEHFYVQNQKTIHSLKQMLFRTSCERIPMQTVCTSTLCLCSRPSGLWPHRDESGNHAGHVYHGSGACAGIPLEPRKGSLDAAGELRVRIQEVARTEKRRTRVRRSA